MSQGIPNTVAGNSPNGNIDYEPRKDVVGGSLFAALQIVFLTVLSATQGGEINVEVLTGALSLLLAAGFAYLFARFKALAAAVGGGLSIVIGAALTWWLGGQVDLAALSTALTTLSFVAVQIAIQLRPPAGVGNTPR